MTTIPIVIRETAGLSRPGEVIRLGVPWPRGQVQSTDIISARGPTGELLPCQTRPLATWPDGSVKWLEVMFAASVEASQTAMYQLSRGGQAPPAPPLKIEEHEDEISVDTGTVRFVLPRHGSRLLTQARVGDSDLLSGDGVQATLIDNHGTSWSPVIEDIEVETCGPLCCSVSFHGHYRKCGLRIFGRWTFYTGSALASLELTVHNPSRARHQRGLWDLGDPGSILFRALCIDATFAAMPTEIRWRERQKEPWNTQPDGELEIVQQSSGCENLCGRTPVDRHGRMTPHELGYYVRSRSGEHRGLRAEPVCTVQVAHRWVAAGVQEFWQHYPKSLEIAGCRLRIGIFPNDRREHELQGGEQKTTRLGFVFGARDAGELHELAAVTAPLVAVCENSSVVASCAVPRLPRSRAALRGEWNILARSALEGDHSFFAKREIADEYGWRNFGDLWADHEQAYYYGPKPIVSHYNNQYDALEGFLLSYLLTSDERWWRLADPLARHVIDIDIYHTTQDRAAYNGGLFWHTNHYCDAVTSTHRAYSRVNQPQGGGGPSNEHNYTSGLLLYYYLTGQQQARDAVVSLAEWVLHMDDGRKHVLGLVHDAPTGFASRTTEAAYHGPGRGAGNSLNALLDGWLVTDRCEFLAKAEEIIRRTIHPADDIPALELNNAELRWSYTVFLQALGRVLDLAPECHFSAETIDYTRASLQHYARWMAVHETFYLDRPEQLEFPTETWAAQELRKANVLMAAARYADSDECLIFCEKARGVYDRAWSKLMSFSSRNMTRPVVLAIQLGLSAACLAEGAPIRTEAIVDRAQFDLRNRQPFVPQKEVVRRKLRSPAQLVAMVVRLSRVWRWNDIWQTTWSAQRLRRVWGKLTG